MKTADHPRHLDGRFAFLEQRAVLERLDAEAVKRGTSAASLVRQAVRAWLAENVVEVQGKQARQG